MNVWDFSSAIVRLPAESAVNGLRAAGGPAPSAEAIRAEHRAYVGALESLGVTVETLEPLEDFPDSMFVEDAGLVFLEAAILLRPGAPSRAGEVALIEPALRRRFGRMLVLDEGQVDGGDVLVTPEIVLIGCSNRTDEAGARRLAALLAEIGRQARMVATPRGTLHLKSDCGLLDEKSVLATPALAASGAVDGFNVLLTPEGEEAGANIVRIGQSVLGGAAYPRTIELIDSLGLTPIVLDTSEIAKIDAGLSCMSLRW